MIPRYGSASLLIALCVSLSGAMPAAAQDLHPSRRPSPVGIAKTFVGDTYVKVTYGRPYTRNRAVFGDPADGATYLVPFGHRWRTGANEATETTSSSAVNVWNRRSAKRWPSSESSDGWPKVAMSREIRVTAVAAASNTAPIFS